ncbi:unnamed protein product [Leptosia nina]|uniref:Uncharacterized protein n=1 Tax=Leptosia nina TaxID=320188 RepID=A0AAV1JTY5_9NEOP
MAEGCSIAVMMRGARLRAITTPRDIIIAFNSSGGKQQPSPVASSSKSGDLSANLGPTTVADANCAITVRVSLSYPLRDAGRLVCKLSANAHFTRRHTLMDFVEGRASEMLWLK